MEDIDMGKLIVLRGGDGWSVEVTLELAFKIPLMRDKLKQDILANTLKTRYKIIGISRVPLNWVIDYLDDTASASDSDYLIDYRHKLAHLSVVSLFNLIQAAHFLKMDSLLDLTCKTLAINVATKITQFLTPSLCNSLISTYTFPDIFKVFDIKRQAFLKASKRDVHTTPGSRDSDSNSILRNRTQGAFINDLDLLAMHFSTPLTNELRPINTYCQRWQSPFNKCVEEIDKSTGIEELVKALHKLDALVREDFRVATCLSGNITGGLVIILQKSKYKYDIEIDVQRPIISIISHARFDTCNDVVRILVVPTLVNIVSDGNIEVSNTAMLALMRLAFIFPKRYEVFLGKAALGAAKRVYNDFRDAHTNMSSLAMFLAAVCRGYSVAYRFGDPSDEVEKFLPILEDLLKFYEERYDKTRIFACYALSYLTYGKYVPLARRTFGRLHSCFSNDNTSLFGSALGVVGNIARWGTLDQIEGLLDYGLMDSLVDVLPVKYKKFLKEACQIISNVAARHGTLIRELIVADLVKYLCSFLEKEVSDVKLEAAWAIFHGIHGFTREGEIDQYPETVVNKYISRDIEVHKGDVNGSAGR